MPAKTAFSFFPVSPMISTPKKLPWRWKWNSGSINSDSYGSYSILLKFINYLNKAFADFVF